MSQAPSKGGKSDRPSAKEAAPHAHPHSSGSKGTEERVDAKAKSLLHKSVLSKRTVAPASTDQTKHIMAAVYFINWQRDILRTYVKSINELFVVPLVEHCSRKKVAISEDSTQSVNVSEAAHKIEAGPRTDEENAEVVKLQDRLQGKVHMDDYGLTRLLEAMKKISGGSGGSAHYRPVQKQKWISVAECAAMSRLKTLNQISASLLVELQNVSAWMQKKENMTVLAKYAAHCSPCLEQTIVAFEAVCSLADIFNLEYVDRSKAKSEYKDLLEPIEQPDDGKGRNKPLEIYDGEPHPDKVKGYIKTLEARINYYRTAVNLIGVSLRDIVIVMLKSIPKDFLEITTKDLKTILDRLPPAYRFPDETFRLTPYFGKVLSETPPNPRQLVPISVNLARTSGSHLSVATSGTSAHAAPRTPRSPMTDSLSQRSPPSELTPQATQRSASNTLRSKKSRDAYTDSRVADYSPPTARNKTSS